LRPNPQIGLKYKNTFANRIQIVLLYKLHYLSSLIKPLMQSQSAKWLALALIFHCAVSFSQENKIFPIYQTGQFPTPFIDLTGTVMFTIPAGHRPVVREPDAEVKPTHATVDMELLNDGICVVKDPKGNFYWINAKGATIKNFGKQYERMSPFKNGYSRAWQKKPEKNYEHHGVYLDANGNNVFNKLFNEISTFHNGYAAVQLDTTWMFIDKQGNPAIRITETLPHREIRKVGSLKEGLATVQLSNQRYYFVDSTGSVALNVSKLFPGKQVVEVDDFSDGVAAVQVYNAGRNEGVYYIDKKGTLVLSFKHGTTHSDFVNGLAYVTQEQPLGNGMYSRKLKLIDKQGNEQPLPAMQVWHNGVHICAEHLVLDGGDARGPFEVVISLGADTVHYYSHNRRIAGLYQHWVATDVLFGETVEVINFKTRETIWSTPTNQRLFSSIDEAMKHADEVTRLMLFSQETFPKEIFKFKNLTELTFNDADFQQIPPGLASLKKLKKLQLISVNNLVAFPIDFASTTIQHLSIERCKKLTGISAMLQNTPSLRLAELVNFNVPDELIERLKKLRPQLRVETTWSFSSGLEAED
jgi:hypothetical protein